MLFGWNGRILYVDLTKEKIWKESLSKELMKKYIGGRGINIKLLWELNKPGIDPLDPDNALIFASNALIF